MPEVPTGTMLSHSVVFRPNELPVRTMPNGGKSWDIIRGTLQTGEAVAVHASTQPAGLPPNPQHKIAHSVFIFVREGTLEFQCDGKTTRVDAGGVIFVAPSSLHTARNAGNGPASYFVISIGGDTK